MTTRRKLRRALVSHVIGIVGLLALVLAVIGAFAGPGEAADPLSVTPSTNLTDGQQVTVTGTSLGVTGLVAVVECGNADSSGTALPGNAPTPADCYGAESIGTGTILVPVANDSATTPYTVHTSGIGANGRKCISGGNFDCVIAMADVATQGNVLRIAASISFGGGGATTTTSAGSTTTTTTSSTTTTTAAPSGPKLTVEPPTNLIDGQSVTVTGTKVGASNFVAVVECGNADASGNPLPGNAPTPADCYGAESVGTGTILITANADGTASTPYIVHDHGIGGSNRECIKNGNFDCLIVMADVATQGNTLRISQPIAFASSPPVTTAPTALGASSGATPASTPTGAATTTGRRGTLPFTGLPPSIWLTIGMALCLLDLGYLLWSATRPPRRRNTV